MSNILDESILDTGCVGCSACANACPKQCLEMIRDKEGFLRPFLHPDSCINCGICKKSCPVLSDKFPLPQELDIPAYAVNTTNEPLRMSSSSGGIFSELAAYVLNNGGVVFGAGFDGNWKVVHKSVESVDELHLLRGSKYVQSDIGTTYAEAKEFLNSGRLVLFSGTPCQIAGLKSFISKSYDNLITVDFICHGVPSPLVWEQYVAYHAKKSKSNIKNIFFRNKDKGWKKFSICFEFENSKKYLKLASEDPYMRSFLGDLCLRPSCYECKFKNIVRDSDFTLADYWGVQKDFPDMTDDKGTSLLIINSEAGKHIFERIAEKTEYRAANVSVALQHNPSYYVSVKKPANRDNFMSSVSSVGFTKASKRYLKNIYLIKIKNNVNAFIKFIKKA